MIRACSSERPPTHVFNGHNAGGADPHPLKGVQCTLHSQSTTTVPGQAYNCVVAVPFLAVVAAYAKFWEDTQEATAVFWHAEGFFLDDDTLAIPANTTELNELQTGTPPDVAA